MSKDFEAARDEILIYMKNGGCDDKEARRLLRNWTSRIERRQEKYLRSKWDFVAKPWKERRWASKDGTRVFHEKEPGLIVSQPKAIPGFRLPTSTTSPKKRGSSTSGR